MLRVPESQRQMGGEKGKSSIKDDVKLIYADLSATKANKFRMDFTGQKAAEELSFVIVIATSIIAFVAGAVKLRSHVSRFVCIELIAQLLACRLY